MLRVVVRRDDEGACLSPKANVGQVPDDCAPCAASACAPDLVCDLDPRAVELMLVLDVHPPERGAHIVCLC